MLQITKIPDGFKESASGLVLPEEVARPRQVWTHDEKRLLDRAAKLCASRGVRMGLACTHQDCSGQQLVKVPQLDGSFLMRCDHMDRHFAKV